MKYQVINDISIFQFHDARPTFISYENNTLKLSVESLNIIHSTEQNPNEADMEIKEAFITFENFNVISTDTGLAYIKNDNGEITELERIKHTGKDAEEFFFNRLKNEEIFDILDFVKNDIGSYSMIIFGGGQFTLIFDCDNITIEWDEYNGKAWYWGHTGYQYNMHLDTPDGPTESELTIVYHTEPLNYKGEIIEPPFVQAMLEYKGEKYITQGKNALWLDAIADIQKKLPEGVKLKGCFNCRHGNECPLGTCPGTVYCTKGLTVRTEQDATDIITAPNGQDLLKRIDELCEDHVYLTKDFFTYNSYLTFMEE